MKLFIVTQDQENYGAHSWNGEGECPQYWKFKGGSDFVVPLPVGINYANILPIVEALIAHYQIERSDDYWVSQVIDWQVVPDDEMTSWERDTLRFDGKMEESPRLAFLACVLI